MFSNCVENKSQNKLCSFIVRSKRLSSFKILFYNFWWLQIFRSRRSQTIYKLGALKNFAKFTGNHLWRYLYLMHYQGASIFSCEFCTILITSFLKEHVRTTPANIYRLKPNNRNTRTRCKMYSKLMTETAEPRHWRRSGVIFVKFEQISHVVLVFLMLTLNM